MKVNRTLVWPLWTIMYLSMSMSCQDIDKKKRTASSVEDSQTKIDTTLWLKKTRGIRDIIEDKQGNFWFSSPDYVARFNGKDMYYFSENDGLNITGNLHEDSNGTIWVEDGFRAFRYNGESFLEERLDSITNASGLWIQRGLNPADTSFVQPGLYEVNRETTKFYPLPTKRKVNSNFLHFPTTKASFGKDSTVWIGTMENVYGFKNNSFTVIGREEMGRQNDERQIGIRGIFVDSTGKLWMADNGAGIFTYSGNEITNFTKKYQLDEGDTDGNTLHRAFSIAEDFNGIMWFGTVYSGIWSYNPTTEEFTNYTSDDGVKSDNIWMIYETKGGELLFAGESPAAVYVFNGNSFDRKY